MCLVARFGGVDVNREPTAQSHELIVALCAVHGWIFYVNDRDTARLGWAWSADEDTPCAPSLLRRFHTFQAEISAT